MHEHGKKRVFHTTTHQAKVLYVEDKFDQRRQTMSNLMPQKGDQHPGDLPDNIQIDILSRLPVKDLLRFKSVCKNWSDLISDPYFIELHKSRARRTVIQSLSFCASEEILSSTGGLVCVKTSNRSYAISNPATRQFLQLPTPPHKLHKLKLYSLPSTGELKMVGTTSGPFWDVLTIGEGSSWRMVHAPFWGDDANVRCCGSFLSDNGAHALVARKDSWSCEAILSLDIETEQVIKNAVPSEGVTFIRDMIFAEWDGCFSFGFYVGQDIRTWVLEDYRTNRWRKEVIVSPPFLSFDLLDLIYVYGRKMWWAIKTYCWRHWCENDAIEVFSLDLESERMEYMYMPIYRRVCLYIPTLETLKGI